MYIQLGLLLSYHKSKTLEGEGVKNCISPPCGPYADFQEFKAICYNTKKSLKKGARWLYGFYSVCFVDSDPDPQGSEFF